MGADQDAPQLFGDEQDPSEERVAPPLKRRAFSTRKPEEEEKEDAKDEREEKLELCKQVGRIGGIETQLDFDSGFGEVKVHDQDGRDVEALSRFSTIRANTAVFAGKYYYEVRLMTSGLMQIGWCTLASNFNYESGVGDDPTSYAYDGYRIKKWNDQSSDFGQAWSRGDVIGTLIDFDARQISFYRNDMCLGVAFKQILVGPNRAYFPAVSMQANERVQFNFGASKPFRVRRLSSFCAVQEPDCQIHNYYSTAQNMLETMKHYVVQYIENQALDEDSKIMVGSILWEYFIPLLNEPYIMEDVMIHFFFDLIMIQKHNYFDAIVKTMEVHFSFEQLCDWMALFMKILCRKITEISIAKLDRPDNKDLDMNYYKIVIELIKRPAFFSAWLCSDNFFDDLENLYFIHVPSRTDWIQLIQCIYHPLFEKSIPYKQTYQERVKLVSLNYERAQAHLFEITEMLLSPLHLKEAEMSPRALFLEFLQQILLKNKDAHKRTKPAGLSPSTTLINVFMCCTKHLYTVVNGPLSSFPYPCFFIQQLATVFVQGEEFMRGMERIGGTFQHQESELIEKLKQFIGPEGQLKMQDGSIPERGKYLSQQQQDAFIFVNALVHLAQVGIMHEMSNYVKIVEKLHITKKKLVDLTESGQQEFGKSIEAEIEQQVQSLSAFELLLVPPQNSIQIHKFCLFLTRLLNFIEERHGDVVYIMPECFAQMSFEVFRTFKRVNVPLLDNEEEQKLYSADFQEIYCGRENIRRTCFSLELAKYISRHFFDPKIANPDQKERYLTRLNVMLQYNSYVRMLEKVDEPRRKFIPMLLQSVEKMYMVPAVKNMLRLQKGQGFKEPQVKTLMIEDTYSPFFLAELRRVLLEGMDEKATKEFLNSVFNNLNEVTTEFFVTLKELKNNYHQQLLSRTRNYFQLIVDFCRLLEILCQHAPELFVYRHQINSYRLLSYIMFVLNSVFNGGLQNQLRYFTHRLQSKIETLPYFLAAFVGILKNLYEAVNKLGPSAGRFASFHEMAERADSFDLKLVVNLVELIQNELPPENKKELEAMEVVDSLVQEVEMMMKASSHSKIQQQQKSQDEQDEDDDAMCNICYSQPKDAVMVPCNHQACQNCIRMVMQNSEKCPYCNVQIQKFNSLIKQ